MLPEPMRTGERQPCGPRVFRGLLFAGFQVLFCICLWPTSEPPVVSSYGTLSTVAAGGPAFPFFIKKRKQEIECKTLQRLESHRSCEFNHTPARKRKYSSHRNVPRLSWPTRCFSDLNQIVEMKGLNLGQEGYRWAIVD